MSALAGLPPKVEHYLRTLLVDHAHPVLFSFNAAWRLIDVHGDLSFYGIARDGSTGSVREIEDLFVGMDMDGDQDIPFVELSGGRSAHVHLIADGDAFHVLLLDAENERERQRVQQQIGNEAVLAGQEKSRAIGRLKEIRNELERQRAELEEANSLKNALIATLSHEFRTPLTSVFGYLHLLEQHGVGAPGAVPALQAIRRNATHLFTLAENLLEYARGESTEGLLNPVVVDFATLAGDLEAMFRPLAEDKGIAFRIELIHDEADTPIFDDVRLRQVMINLLSNAVRYTARGEIVATIAWLDRHLNIRVRDTGIGISSEFQESVFRPFNRGGQVGRKGAGLGLSIVRRLIAQMHGTLALESQPGQGTCFAIDLPPLQQRLPPSSRTGRPLPGTTALIVDDDPDIVQMLKVLLTDLGFCVRSADNGADAIAQAMQSPPDVLLVDVEMPGLSGNATVYQLRTRGYKGRIVTLSATATTAARDASLRAGADFYLTKPLDVAQFLATMQASLPDA